MTDPRRYFEPNKTSTGKWILLTSISVTWISFEFSGEEPHDYTTFTQLAPGGTSISSSTTASSPSSVPATPTSSNSNGATANSISTGNAGGQSSPVGFSAVFSQTNSSTPTTTAAQTASSTTTTTGGGGSSLRGTPPPSSGLPSSAPVTALTSPTATNTATVAQGASPISVGVGVIQQAGAYRQRSGSATSRHRADSLSSHDENSRDQKQIRRIGG